MSAKSVKLMNQKFGRTDNSLTHNISMNINNFNAITNNFKVDSFNQTRLMSGLNQQKFNQSEVKRSFKVINQYTGKHEIDQRYYDQVWKEQQQAKRLQICETKHSEQSESEKREEGSKEEKSKLDRYIDMILNNVIHEEEFIYLQRNSIDNPYDLKVINHETLKKNKDTITNYFTISKKGLVNYQNGIPYEFLTLAEWIKERETYNQIK